jgi:hypothetical protein
MYIHSFIHSYPIPTTYRMCIHTYVHMYVHTHYTPHTYVHMYVRTYIDTNIRYGTVLSLKTLHGMVWYGTKDQRPWNLKKVRMTIAILIMYIGYMYVCIYHAKIIQAPCYEHVIIWNYNEGVYSSPLPQETSGSLFCPL